MLTRLQSERGHIGVTLGSVLAVVGTILLAIGLGNDNNGMSVAGAIVLGAGSLLGMQAPHIWMRSVYRRLDKVDPEDHESMPEKRFRTQF
jgi:drug/metabolite transporter (DMT)-like permease